MEKRPKIGLAIGSGAAYGLAAIGVLKVLEENKIPIDCISGTSMGAVIGALYASGMKSFRLEDELFGMQWKDLLDFVLPKKGLVSGEKAENYIRELIKNKTFEELEIPLYIVSVDINKGQQIVFDKGDVASAVRASMAIPGVFTPVEMGGMMLVDGAVLDPLPTDVLKKHADVIIAVSFTREVKQSYVSAKREKSEFLKAIKQEFIKSEVNNVKEYIKKRKIKIPIPFRWLLSPNWVYGLIRKHKMPVSSFEILEVTKKSHYIMANEMAKLKLQINKPDVLIKPELSKMNWLEFDKGSYALKQGELAAKEKIKQIKRILKKR